jgi:hypothetical protein
MPDAPGPAARPDTPPPSAPAADAVSGTPSGAATTDADPPLQGEGNITAARRHRQAAQDFIEAGRVQPAADRAAPADAAEAQELRDAEAEGRAHAKR